MTSERIWQWSNFVYEITVWEILDHEHNYRAYSVDLKDLRPEGLRRGSKRAKNLVFTCDGYFDWESADRCSARALGIGADWVEEICEDYAADEDAY